jgi:ATP-dependent DNA helicase DinG
MQSKALLEEAFAADGLLARSVPAFRQRAQQLEMAHAILETLEQSRVLAVEAGTGTGKTFAYLVPALAAGGKVIISTGTKTLQDQLYERDLPTVRRALATGVSAALLKGRANYVCLYRLERAQHELRGSRQESADLRRIAAFAAHSASGDRAELADVPEDAPAWLHATSTRDNCLGQECPSYRECFVMRARKNALDADVVVVNHHLFFADVALRDEGIAELLPACNTVIFDEAHQLPETARLFFGERLSTSQLIELARDARIELRGAGLVSPELDACAAQLDKAARDLRLALEGLGPRTSWLQASRGADVSSALEALEHALAGLGAALDSPAGSAEGIAACARRAAAARAMLARFTAADDVEDVRWLDISAASVQLHVTPLSVAELFKRQMADHPRAWIFTSATLAVGGSFAHFTRELGLEDAAARSWPSPFAFEEQALLYVPRGLPANPNDSEYVDAVVDAAYPVLRASRGRAFLLFTSLRALRRARELLEARLFRDGDPYPLLVQGNGSRSELLARFRALGNAVLLGSQTFWEGVDVRGEALSLVVIDKLPFAPPDDPVLAARIDALAARGGNPFMEIQLPRAILQLKQGVGRLIRDENDRGVLMLCDPRLFSKGYGRVVRESLPPMRLTRELSDVQRFFEAESS